MELVNDPFFLTKGSVMHFSVYWFSTSRRPCYYLHYRYEPTSPMPLLLALCLVWAHKDYVEAWQATLHRLNKLNYLARRNNILLHRGLQDGDCVRYENGCHKTALH